MSVHCHEEISWHYLFTLTSIQFSCFTFIFSYSWNNLHCECTS